MGWISNPGSSLPAASVGCDVKTSKQSASTIVFAKNGSTTIRQIETIETTEYRGLDKTSALAKAGVTDNTVQTKYYATIDGEQYSITLMSGTKTEVTAQRSNEADGWTVTSRVTTYTSNPATSATAFTNVWSTSIAASSATGTVESYERSRSHCITCGPTGNRFALYSTKTVTVTEYKNLTQSAAQTLVNNNTADTVTDKTLYFQNYYDSSWHTGLWYTLQTGTEKRASMRSAGDGAYSVTVTQTDYGYTHTANTSSYRWTENPNS